LEIEVIQPDELQRASECRVATDREQIALAGSGAADLDLSHKAFAGVNAIQAF